MSDRFSGQRINIRFCAKLGNNATGTYTVLFEDYEKEAMKEPSVFEWHKLFKEGRENMEYDERSGRTRSHRADENVEKVRNAVHSDRC
jgi:hypothetical protein